MAAQGEVRLYDEQAMFVLEIDGIEQGYFETCSEYMDESATIEQREGGTKKVVAKIDGPQTYQPITLTRGAASEDRTLSAWRQEVRDNGSVASERNASIVQLNPDGSEKGRINLKRCWPKSYKIGGWDASAEETTKEELVLEFHDAEVVQP